MTLATDFLEQATHLASREKGKPKQASLRRAISAAYYSVFHLVVADGARRIVDVPRLRNVVARTFEHRKLLTIASAIERISTKPKEQHWLREHLSSHIAPGLTSFCRTFVSLQDQRHDADYDAAATFTRSEVVGVVTLARDAHVEWAKERDSDNALVFLLAAAGLLRDR